MPVVSLPRGSWGKIRRRGQDSGLFPDVFRGGVCGDVAGRNSCASHGRGGAAAAGPAAGAAVADSRSGQGAGSDVRSEDSTFTHITLLPAALDLIQAYNHPFPPQVPSTPGPSTSSHPSSYSAPPETPRCSPPSPAAATPPSPGPFWPLRSTLRFAHRLHRPPDSPSSSARWCPQGLCLPTSGGAEILPRSGASRSSSRLGVRLP